MDLYELTRKLVARGCPEPQVVDCAGTTSAAVWYSPESDESCGTGGRAVWFVNTVNGFTDETSEEIARAIWTMLALEWYRNNSDVFCGGKAPIDAVIMDTAGGVGLEHGCYMGESDYEGFRRHCESPTILEAIEAATRHLEPKPNRQISVDLDRGTVTKGPPSP